ncbi:MAG: hypothetical protein IPM29_05925 [Planctomycetes bacterium]|nr:hypothetical protein [Planctomycetota bacterium]
MRVPHLCFVSLSALLGSVGAQSIVLGNGTPDPAYPNLWSWYDAANGPNSSPTPLPDGTQVTQWDDRSINARHLARIATDPLRRPTVEDDAESCGVAMGFDGNDYIWAAFADIGRLAGDRTFFAVVNVRDADGGYVFDGSTFSGRTTLHTGETANPGLWHSFFGDNTQPTPNGYSMLSVPVATNRYQIHALVLTNGVQEHYINGQLQTTTTFPSVFNLGGLIVGSRANTANGLNGYVKELLIYSEAVNPANRSLLEAYFVARHPLAYGEVYGAGCAGTGGLVPQLVNAGCPVPGGSFDLVVRDGLPLSVAVIDFGLMRANLPVGPCTLLISPIVLGVGGPTDANGAFRLPLAVPAGLALTLPTQALVVDPQAGLGASATNGLELVIF